MLSEILKIIILINSKKSLLKLMLQVAFAFMNAKATYCISVSNDFLLEIKFTVF